MNKTQTQTTPAAAPAIAAPAAATPAPTTAPAPEASTGNLSLDQLAKSYSRRSRAAATPAQAAPTQSATPASPKASSSQAVPERPANTAEAALPTVEEEAETPPEDETTPAEAEALAEPPPEGETGTEEAPNEDAAPEGAPDLPAAETDAMTDAEFAQYVSGLTESKAQRKMLQRIHRLTWRLKASEQAKTAKPENTPAQPPAGPDLGSNPLLKAINTDLQNVNSALDWCEEHPEGGEYTDPNGKVRNFTQAETRAIRRNSEAARTEILAERANVTTGLRQAHQQLAQKAEADFAKAYPHLAEDPPVELTDAQVKDKAAFQALAGMMPSLRQFPDWKLWLGWAVEGKKAYDTRLKAPPRVGAPMVRPKGSTVPPAVTAAPAAGAPRVNGLQKQVQEAQTKFQSTGKLEDLAKTFSTRRRLQRQPA